MDIDVIQPLPFRPFPSATPMSRSTSGKRARSPDADAYFASDHPSKRIFIRNFGVSDGSRSPGGSSHGGGGDAHGSASSSRHPSEDWVVQAGGLSIDSPMFHSRSSTNSSLENLHHSLNPLDDVDMAMDTEEHSSSLIAAHNTTSSSSSSMSVSLDDHPNSLLPNPTTSILHTAIINSHPQINIHPATPTPSIGSSTRASSRASSIHRHPTPEPQQVPSESQSPMALSPSPSFSQPQPQLLATPRRPRFTMGPRVDCEKCRLGVKGHWAHLD